MKGLVKTISLAVLAGAWVSAQAATVLTAQGKVSVDSVPQQLALGSQLDEAATVETGGDGYLQLAFDDGSILSVSHNSAVALAEKRLQSGGLDLLSGDEPATLQIEDYALKTRGFLRVRMCGKGCSEDKGTHGKIAAGEVIIEYPGGRVVMKDKPFLMAGKGARPTMQAVDSELLAENNQLRSAERVREQIAAKLQSGLEAFKQGDNQGAISILNEVQELAPTEALATYYKGLAYLELDDKDNALKELQAYRDADSEGAKQRNVAQLITLLLTDKLQREVQMAVAMEDDVNTVEVEPGSIAVQPFVNKGSPQYATLAKGIAAMMISDLSQVPGLKVLERQKVQKLLDEIRLSESGLVDRDAMVKAGRMARAEKVIFGNFGVEQ